MVYNKKHILIAFSLLIIVLGSIIIIYNSEIISIKNAFENTVETLYENGYYVIKMELNQNKIVIEPAFGIVRKIRIQGHLDNVNNSPPVYAYNYYCNFLTGEILEKIAVGFAPV